MGRLRQRGFTLIELMIVICIVGIITALAIPEFSAVLVRSQEGTTKGNLGSLRSAVSLYYGDNEGTYPAAIVTLLQGARYLPAVPLANLPGLHPQTSIQSGAWFMVNGNPCGTMQVTDMGGWAYAGPGVTFTFGSNGPYYLCQMGAVNVDCSHQDARGIIWSTY